MASPTERAGKVCLLLQFDGPLSKSDAEKWLPPGSLVVTPEDIEAGWRVLTPEQAAWCRATINRLSRYGLSEEDAAAVELALGYLAGVPGKGSDT